jgi:DNA-binding IclR family transcriptional regulator
VGGAGDAVTSAHLSEALGMDRSTVHRLATTLERRGLIQRHGRQGFVIGDRLSHLALAGTPDPRLAVVPALTDLVDLTGESASFSIRYGESFYCVAHQSSPHELSYSPVAGCSYPLHSGAAGLALWAFLPDGARDELLDTAELQAFTPSTVTDRAQLRAELDQVRARGYATSAGVRTPGGCSIAAPVLLSNGRVAGALAISAADIRVPLDTLTACHPQLRAAADRLAHTLNPFPERP